MEFCLYLSPSEFLEILDGLRAAPSTPTPTEIAIMATLEEVNAAVARVDGVVPSVIAFITMIVQKLRDAQASTDPAALQAVIDHLDTNVANLANAVASFTPDSPVEPEPEPVVV